MFTHLKLHRDAQLQVGENQSDLLQRRTNIFKILQLKTRLNFCNLYENTDSWRIVIYVRLDSLNILGYRSATIWL